MNPAKNIEQTVQAVCDAAPGNKVYRRVRTVSVWALRALICAIAYHCWNHGGAIVDSLWGWVSWKGDRALFPAAHLFLLLVGGAFAAAIAYEVANTEEKKAAVNNGIATDDLLLAIVHNPHIPQSAKASLAREIEEHGFVSEEALGKIAARAERDAVVQQRQAAIRQARNERQLGPGASALLNYCRDGERAKRDA